MAFVDKSIAKVGLEIFGGYDDRPFDMCGCNKGIITDVFDDHYLWTDTDNNLNNIWGEYEPYDTLMNYTTKAEVDKWLNRNKNRRMAWNTL